jgi:hypothetical protein
MSRTRCWALSEPSESYMWGKTSGEQDDVLGRKGGQHLLQVLHGRLGRSLLVLELEAPTGQC